MAESITNTADENVIDISIHTNKRTILINGLKNVIIRSRDKQYLFPFSELKELIITGDCNSNEINKHIQCFSHL